MRETRSHGTPGFPVGIYEMRQEAGQPILENHWHEEAEFLFVEDGQATFRIGYDEYELAAGDAVFIDGGELHGAFPLNGSGCSYRAVVFDLNWLIDPKDGISSRFLQPLSRGRIALATPFGSASEWGRRVLESLRAITDMEVSEDPAKEMRVKGLLYLLLAEFWTSGEWKARSRADSQDAKTIERMKGAMAHIELHFNRRLPVGELAEIAGMSEGHFSRVFKEFMRKTPVEYINHYRLRHAALRLGESDLTVGEVALESGFDNFSYFSKMFKALYHCSPSDYRRRHGGGT
ncbi:AraC family transcriptional regulator [Cohnella thailandensis]|uniref:Helix-turn-helix transcriptional regulator n=1 Tax=Cohnella thailandensis TaxID=557557 RepID=A0A841SW94_9BACL|nr:AraC family transcriptional regulator [Cohnella thailandensis]MBB6635502.1 helix-turn-helix transcriptional regulator [Cohnella thailandensis]MBP1974882.1 AraC-like DNA-binding protein [Cohnella thailandensis]